MVTMPFVPDPRVPSLREDMRPQVAVSFSPSSPAGHGDGEEKGQATVKLSVKFVKLHAD